MHVGHLAVEDAARLDASAFRFAAGGCVRGGVQREVQQQTPASLGGCLAGHRCGQLLAQRKVLVRVDEVEVVVLGGHKAQRAVRVRQRHHDVVRLDELHHALHLLPEWQRLGGFCCLLRLLAELWLEGEIQDAVLLVDVQHAACYLLSRRQLLCGLVVGDQAQQVLMTIQVAHDAVVLQLMHLAVHRRADGERAGPVHWLALRRRQRVSGLVVGEQGRQQAAVLGGGQAGLERDPKLAVRNVDLHHLGPH
mmetsp:Transcript_13099/g.33673  ORF Transcript_13099/g.33673 Transcript_13099/m.33673 type:complete len:250 (+) Transcript_13099:196-945(+)